jgi:hypothetical protein
VRAIYHAALAEVLTENYDDGGGSTITIDNRNESLTIHHHFDSPQVDIRYRFLTSFRLHERSYREWDQEFSLEDPDFIINVLNFLHECTRHKGD